MLIRDRFDGVGNPFEGDRELVLRRLPAGARIADARVVVRPGADSLIRLEDPELWGAEIRSQPGWVEVDFHARRTLANVTGVDLNDASLQVDLGGVFTDVNSRGALGGSAGDLFTLATVTGGPLPGLTVTGFRLTSPETSPPQTPGVSRVDIRSLPSNLTLSLGAQPPFWAHPGDLSEAVTSPDFTAVLQDFLESARVENGFYVLPLVIHSDTLARIEITVEIEILCSQSVLPEGLDEVAMSFEVGGLSTSASDPLQVDLPTNARVRQTFGRASGAFEPSRVVVGPTGEVEIGETIEISAGLSQAQMLTLPEPASADAVDLLVAAVSRTARLQLDLFEDLDGKPGGVSFLSEPVAFELDRRTAGTPVWISARLPTRVQLAAAGERRYWLVVQSLEGEAVWATQFAEPDAAGMEQTADGGLSWRRTGTEPLTAYYRLRRDTERFHMPLELRVGRGEATQRIGLERFEAAGRVDLALDFPEIAGSFNSYLESALPTCSEAEHLANSDFSEWLDDGAYYFAAAVAPGAQLLAEWALTSGLLTQAFDGGGAFLGPFENEFDGPTSLSQVVPVSGSCSYDFTFVTLDISVLARDAGAEVHWLDDCALLRTDSLPIEEAFEDPSRQIPVYHRARLEAPAAATQAEVRFLVPEGQVWLQSVSLRGAVSSTVNGDLRALDGGLPAGWAQVPESALDAPPSLSVSSASDAVLLHNTGSEPLFLVQTADAEAGRSYTFDFQGREATQGEAATQARLRWLNSDAEPIGDEIALDIAASGFEGLVAKGEAPVGTTRVEVDLSLPVGSEIEIQRVDLRFDQLSTVPLIPVTQSPGTLRVTDLEVLWDLVEVAPPEQSSAGLCTPTPPGLMPGELGDCECCCSSCGSRQEMQNPEARVTASGRAARVANCASCGAGMIRFGGLPSPDARRVAGGRQVVNTPLPPRTEPAEPAAPSQPTSPPAASPADAHSPTRITGIGEKRAQQLRARGIDTLEKLAAATPEDLQGTLSIQHVLAVDFIRQARELLAAE